MDLELNLKFQLKNILECSGEYEFDLEGYLTFEAFLFTRLNK